MTMIHRYRVRCTTDNQWEYVWLPADDPAPTTCPSDAAHSIDSSATSIVATAGDDTPATSDNRPIVVSSRFSKGIDPYLCGVGDDMATGQKGAGTKLRFDDVATEETIEFGFVDVVRVAAGGVMWTDCQIGDTLDMWLSAKAAPLTPNAGLGNCNLVDTGLGFNIVVPAAGDGSHDVDLATANLVPNQLGAGHWDWDEPDLGLGTVTPNLGVGAWDMFDVEIKLVHWVCGLPMLGAGEFYLDPNSIDRKIYQRWTWFAKLVSEAQHGAATAAFYLNLARSKTT